MIRLHHFPRMPRCFCDILVLLLTCSAVIEAGEQIEGIFSEKLSAPGYYVVTTIPEGAKHINVTELSHTKNFLAIKLHNGSYLFNKNGNIDSSNKYKGAGTIFIYSRRTEHRLESFYAAGPLKSSIDVMLLYQENCPKVFYQYVLPVEFKTPDSALSDIALAKPLDLESSSVNHFVSTRAENFMLGDEIRTSTVMPRRRKKRRFVWKAMGFSKCSKSCGGGFLSKRYICVRQRRERTHVQVENKRCESLEKPKVVPIRCNSIPCPPQWEAGRWGRCSVTCGNGTRTRELQCVQEMPEQLRIHADGARCPATTPKDIALVEPCFMPDCNIYTTPKSSPTTKQYNIPPRWKVEEWSPCSTTCGNGTRSRTVTCVTFGLACNINDKPIAEENCNMGSCTSKSLTDNEIPEALTDALWLYSAWPEECSAGCGTGTVSRRLYCEKYLTNETCDEDKMPSMNRTCFRSHTCGQWFVGPWTRCSSSCDIGIKTREVVCVSRFLGSLKVVKPNNCPADKPITVDGCMGPPCNATWFMSDWSQCSQSCDGGTQKREVKCIGPDGVPINASMMECDEEEKPVGTRNCNNFSCSQLNVKKTNGIEYAESENEIEDTCSDKLHDCWRVRHKSKDSKRKCQLDYYKSNCCKACRYLSFLTFNGQK